jgi:DNA-binding XRE family transcriptional regulator
MARGGDTKPKTKPFRQLADKINADPARRARVDEHKRVMLAELRQSLDLTQTELAETLDVSQRGVSHVEHEANPRLGTLADYVDALGGRLELRAVFDDRTVELTLPTVSTRKRPSTRAEGRPAARS